MNNIHSKPGFIKGLRPALPDRPHLKFVDFLTGIPPVPAFDQAPQLGYPMSLNDQIGDCVVAAWDHSWQIYNQLLNGTGVNFTSDQLIAFYQTQNPDFDINGTSDTNGPGSSADGGMNIQIFLEYLQQNGYIVGFAKIDHTNLAEFQAATYIGLSVMCGVTLQDAQMDQFNAGQPWNPVEGSPIDGGHGAPSVGFVTQTPNEFTIVTWAKLQQITQAFVNGQMTEAWFVLTKLHCEHPNFRTSDFITAVAEITKGEVTVPTAPVNPLFQETLKEGMISPDVAKLQALLKIATDGIFGPNTLDHVMLFQLHNGLVPDGIVGPKTQLALLSLVSNVPAPTIQPSTTNLIKGFEGFSGTPYQDQGGVWTIGYGATYDLNGNPVTADTAPITEQQGEELLAKQLSSYAATVAKTIKVSINQNQFDACTSLCYNIGQGGFEESTVAKECNASNFPAAAEAFLLWDKVNGQVNQDLVVRRNREMALFLQPVA